MTDGTLTLYGQRAFAGRLSRGRVCVRQLFVLRSVASCVAFVLCWFVWRSCAAAHRGKPKAADCGSEAQGGGRYTGWPRAGYGLRTDGRRAGIGQTWTNPAIPRWAAARGGWTCHGRKRTRHGLHTDDSPTDGQRAADGQATDIRRAADGRAFVCCRHFATFRDGRRHGGLGTGF